MEGLNKCNEKLLLKLPEVNPKNFHNIIFTLNFRIDIGLNLYR